MKSTLLATVSAVGLLALSQAALASPPDSGFAEANIGFGWTDSDHFNGDPFDDPFSFGAKTRWLFPLSQPIHIQGDLFAERIDNVFDNGFWGKEDSTLYGAAAHIIHPMQNGRVGIAGSLFSVDAFGPFIGPGGNANARYALVALEGQYNLERWSFFGQGGWFGDITGCDGREGCVHDGTFVRGNVMYFFTPNASLSFDGKLFWADDENFGTVSGGTARVEGEYRFTDSMYAGFVALDYEREDVDAGFGTAGEDTTTLNLGLRVYFDSATVQEFVQRGAWMNTPTFHHELTSEGTLQEQAFINGIP